MDFYSPGGEEVRRRRSVRAREAMHVLAKDGKVVRFFRTAAKFKSTHAVLGFTDQANRDEGTIWPTDFAPKELTAAEEERIVALVKTAAS